MPISDHNDEGASQEIAHVEIEKCISYLKNQTKILTRAFKSDINLEPMFNFKVSKLIYLVEFTDMMKIANIKKSFAVKQRRMTIEKFRRDILKATIRKNELISKVEDARLEKEKNMIRNENHSQACQSLKNLHDSMKKHLLTVRSVFDILQGLTNFPIKK